MIKVIYLVVYYTLILLFIGISVCSIYYLFKEGVKSEDASNYVFYAIESLLVVFVLSLLGLLLEAED